MSFDKEMERERLKMLELQYEGLIQTYEHIKKERSLVSFSFYKELLADLKRHKTEIIALRKKLLWTK